MVTASDLASLLVNVAGMSDRQIEELARIYYRDLYLNRGRFGVHQTHDNQVLLFHEDAFDHAFYTTSDSFSHPERKDVLRKGSVERIHWIGRLVSGQIQGSACFEVPSQTGRYRPPNRVYATFETPFVVWLEPRRESGWKFRTAYPLSIEDIRKCTQRGRTVWKWKKSGPVIKPAHGARSPVQTD